MSPRSRDNDMKDANDLADIAELAQLVSRDKMDRALHLSHETGRPLWRILLREGMVTDEALFKALGAELRVPVLGEDQLASVIVPPELKAAISYELAQRLGVLPLERSTDGRRAALAMIDPTLDITPLWPALTPIGVVEVRRFLMSLSTLRLGLEQFYGKPYLPDRAEAFAQVEDPTRQAPGTVVLDPQMQAEIAKYSGEHPETGVQVIQSTLPIELRTTMPLGVNLSPLLGEEPTSSQVSADHKSDPHRARLPTPPSTRSGPPSPSSISAPPSGRSLPPAGTPSGKSLPPRVPAQAGGLPRPKSLPPRPPPSRRTPLPELPSAELVLDEVAGASRPTRDKAEPQAAGTTGQVPAAQPSPAPPRSATGPQPVVPPSAPVPLPVSLSDVTQPRSVTGLQAAVPAPTSGPPRSATGPQPVVPASASLKPRSATGPQPVVPASASLKPRSATGPQAVVPSSSSLAPPGGAGEERVHDALLLACEALVSQHEAQLRSTWPTELAHLGKTVAERMGLRPRAARELMLVARLFGLQRVLLSQRGALPAELSTLVGFLGTVPFSAPLRELQASLADFIRLPSESAAPLGARIVRAAARALSLWAEGVSEEALAERLRQTGVDRDVAEAVCRAIEQEPPDREDLRLPPAPPSMPPPAAEAPRPPATAAASQSAPVSAPAPASQSASVSAPAPAPHSASPPAPAAEAPRPPADPVPPSRLSTPSVPAPPLLRPLWPLPPRMPDVPWTTRVVPTLSGETLVPHRPEEL